MGKKNEKDNLNVFSDNSFTKGVAYDLNNLLSAIKGRTVLMMNSVEDSHPIRKQFNEILTCVDKGIKTTELLWGFNRVDKAVRRSK